MSQIGKFSMLEIERELAVVNATLGLLDAEEITEAHLFHDLLQTVFGKAISLNARALADDLGFSYSTVLRWIQERSTPKPVLFEAITDWISRALCVRQHQLRRTIAA